MSTVSKNKIKHQKRLQTQQGVNMQIDAWSKVD